MKAAATARASIADTVAILHRDRIEQLGVNASDASKGEGQDLG
jgi:hypothetical protein